MDRPRLRGAPPSPGPGAHQVALAIRGGKIAIRLTRASGVLRRVNQMSEIATVTQYSRHMAPSLYFRLTRFGGPSLLAERITQKTEILTIWKKRGNEPAPSVPQLVVNNRISKCGQILRFFAFPISIFHLLPPCRFYRFTILPFRRASRGSHCYLSYRFSDMPVLTFLPFFSRLPVLPF